MRNRILLELEFQTCIESGANLWRGEGWQVISQLHWIDFVKIEEMKLEAAVQMQKENKQLELEIKLTQTSQEMMAGLFINVLQNLKK